VDRLDETTAVFDGHNDALGRLQEDDVAPALPDRCPSATSTCRGRGRGGAGRRAVRRERPVAAGGGQAAAWDNPYAEPVGHAGLHSRWARSGAHARAAASDGAVAIVTDAGGLDRARAAGTLGIVLHIEGAEPVDPGLAALEAWYAAGVRSLGLVWSRPNAFGHGVPFRFPASPDIGPGLSAAGLALVRRCGELGIAGVSHLNAAGFADVARLGAGRSPRTPRATLCPASRNLTDDQLRAIAAGEGLVGIVYAVPFLRVDGRNDPDTPLGTLVAHVRHAVDVAGIEHVGLGSDFDGATMPRELGDVAAVPRLLDALRADGFADADVEALAWGNWRRVLAAAWR
jgi:membrane dipeptidase